MNAPDNKEKRLTPAEQLMQRTEGSYKKIEEAVDLNNEAVRLFAEGLLKPDQLTRVSVSLAKGADYLASKILKTDIKKLESPELKQMAYSTMLSLAQENRQRAVDLTLAQQKTPSRAKNNGSHRS